jgi:hypothetical protein
MFSSPPQSFFESEEVLLQSVVITVMVLLAIMLILGWWRRVPAVVLTILVGCVLVEDFGTMTKSLTDYVWDDFFILKGSVIVACFLSLQLPGDCSLGADCGRKPSRLIGACLGAYFMVFVVSLLPELERRHGVPVGLGYAMIALLFLRRLRLIPWMTLLIFWWTVTLVVCRMGVRFKTFYVVGFCAISGFQAFVLLNPNWLKANRGDGAQHLAILDLSTVVGRVLAWLIRFEDRHGVVAFAALDGPEWQRVLEDNPTLAEHNEVLFYARSTGHCVGDVHIGAEAFFRIMYDVGGVAKLTAVVLLMPVRVRWLLYRYVLWKAKSQSDVPPPDLISGNVCVDQS